MLSVVLLVSNHEHLVHRSIIHLRRALCLGHLLHLCLFESGLRKSCVSHHEVCFLTNVAKMSTQPPYVRPSYELKSCFIFCDNVNMMLGGQASVSSL